MTKKNKIVYWIATGWLSLGLLSTGLVQLLKMKEEVALMDHLGYPVYFLTLLGIWKILAVIALLFPKFPIVKEWAYAGVFFFASGAVFSHIAKGDAFVESFGPLLFVVLTAASWYYRPADRKISTASL